MISKDINLNIRYVEVKAMVHKDHYMFTCSMFNFDQQPVPTYWTNSAGKYYYPSKEEVDNVNVETMTDVWDSVHGKGLISLKYKTVEITEDLVFTCKVDVTSPTKETISTVAKIDYITVSVPSNKVYVHTGETVTITATFSGLAADYSNDIVWTLGDVSYTKANVTETVKIESAYSGTGVTTKLILESYTGGDKDIVVMVMRHDVNPAGSKATLHLDQFDIIFDNAYTTSSGSDVSVTCLVSNNKDNPESITITGPTAFTSSQKTGASNAGSFTKVSADGTMNCAVKYGTYTATVQKKLELISISVSDQKWNTGGSSLFTATIGECSFNLVDDINWYIDDKKLTTGITNSYKTGQAAESILVVQGVQTDGTVKIKVGSDHASSASASKALEYYYTKIDKVRVEKDSSATVTCKLESYTGTLLTKLEVTATDGTTNKNNVVTTSTAREVTLTIDKVTKKWTTTCLATVNGVTFTSSNIISQYTFTMKLNNQNMSPSSNWVDLNKQSTMLCEITESDDALSLPPHWFKSSTNVTTGVTTASNSKTTLSVNIPEDVAYTCQFNFDKDNWVRKNFTLVTKGCKTPSLSNTTYTPISELSKVPPGTVINFSCTNNTKFNLMGSNTALCGSTQEGNTNFYAYNTTLPTCFFLGDCTNVTKSFTSGTISPPAPFVNNKNYTFKCDSQYRLDGPEIVTCSQDNWQHSIPRCSFIETKCGTEHWGKAYANFSGPYVQGDVVNVYCSTGYTNTGTGTLQCGANGWDKSAECVKKESNQCAKITPTSGTMICHNDKAAVVTTYTTGVTCEISCEQGYRAVGDTSKIECLEGGVWSRSSYPSCAAYQPPTHRDLEVSLSFSTSYCANSAEQTKMNSAVSTTLTDIQQISCLKNKICTIANFTCAKESDKSFKVTFRLNQVADMSNTTVLTNSATEITAAKDTLSFTVTSAKKKRSAMQIMKIQKRGTTLTFSPSAVTKAAPVSTCPSNTFLENNLCVPCPEGYYLKSGACAACQIGSYNPNTGATQCISCAAPKTTLAMGANAETQCTKTCTVPQVDNVNSTTIPMGDKVEEGAIVYYTCKDGYKIKDAAIYTCAPDHAKPIVPTCESESKTIMWILIAVCGGIVILALFLLVCFCCAIKSRKKSDNSSSSISSSGDKDNYILENKYASAEYSPRTQENSNV